MLKNLKASTIIFFSLTIIIIGISIISFNYLKGKKDETFKTMNIALFESGIPENIETSEEEQFENDEITDIDNNEQQNTNIVSYDYIGILEIPKIKLKKGFVDINSKYNSISYNVTVVQTSNYPDVDKGNLILSAHSGQSYISYFKNLYKLNIGDIAHVYYNNVKYTYKIVDIYYVEKTGMVSIYRDTSKTTLTLITCTEGDLTKQTVYILELTEKNNY